MRFCVTKQWLPIIAVVTLGAVLASGGDNNKRQTINGYLVDLACISQRSSELATLGPKHTKKCLMMPQCERSGYAVLTLDQKVIKFDADGNQRAKKLIASSKREKDYRIVAVGSIVGDEIHVTKLELQK